MQRTSRATAACPAALIVAAFAAPAGAEDARPAGAIDPGPPVGEWVHTCWPVDESGLLTGRRHWHVHDAPDAPVERGLYQAPAVTITDNGDPANRVDLVLVGDGYTEADLPAFASHAQNAADALFGIEPFATYAPLFNVHRVDVVSNESGVDNDPVPGIERDTALDMGFFCSGIERALCVNTFFARMYALNAPEQDQTIAIANSSKYGGVGYPSSDLATMSGANEAAADIAIHEFGHTLGDLADEYTYGGPSTYTGGERPEANVSIYPASEMAARDTKWADWLGVDDPAFDFLQDTFEGGYYSENGVYRPSFNSMMRALGRPFNHPSTEQLIIKIYQSVDPIDASTPTDDPLSPTQTVEVQPVDLPGAPIAIRWLLDGALLDTAGAASLDLASLGLSAGEHTLRVEVVDETMLVRDEQARADYMTGVREWTITADLDPADVNADGSVDSSDLGILLGSWGSCVGCPSDINGDGIVNSDDLAILLGNWSD